MKKCIHYNVCYYVRTTKSCPMCDEFVPSTENDDSREFPKNNCSNCGHSEDGYCENEDGMCDVENECFQYWKPIE